MEVNGRKGRRVVCVLSKDGLRYRIFDLGDATEEPSGDRDGKGDDNVGSRKGSTTPE